MAQGGYPAQRCLVFLRVFEGFEGLIDVAIKTRNFNGERIENPVRGAIFVAPDKAPAAVRGFLSDMVVAGG